MTLGRGKKQKTKKKKKKIIHKIKKLKKNA